MNWDGGGGYIASAVIGSIVMWVLMRVNVQSNVYHANVTNVNNAGSGNVLGGVNGASN